MTHSQPALRPGWREIAAGLAMLVVVGFCGGILIARLPIDPVAIGLIFTALSGIAGMAGFLAAFLLRIRAWEAFGVRPTSGRWLLIGAAAGLAAFLLKSLAILAYIALTGDDVSPQQIYATGASGGAGAALLATIFLTVVTPLGEEFLFRGVVTRALLRYGPFVGVGGGALIFALFHGINIVFPAALVAGVIAGEVFRRSGSIWPAVMVHAVVNLPTIPVMLLASAAP
ncbi:CPBP family intramembrane glutamic endopeptidase [Oceanibaculum pacificum]|uniref:Abortive infection protein n=1 Tax=Oceanibaculum pacificum TaxID=580166 RepID=A0A154W1Y8_9PROT|nr:CPBP family intramembrane glutamic endopeptidase [Oceanibaculum pacificum]KZD07516.1 abortive infection protein [Oceanibaculum pacificum]